MGQALMGGSSQSNSSGYSALPPQLQKEFNPFGAAINYFTLPQFGTPNTTIPGQASAGANRGGGGGNNGGGNNGNRGGAPATPMGPTMGGNMGVTDRFTPLAETDAERGAISNINRGFTPTADSLRSDINMQMDPYMDSVIGGMNRSADGNWSMLKEGLQGAGQGSGAYGSNRSILGANDIDMARQDNIGSFLSNQFNTSLNNAMNVLPGQRTADANNQLQGGSFLRSLDMQTKQAPITALQTGTNMMSPFLSGSRGSQSSSPGLLGPLMSLAMA